MANVLQEPSEKRLIFVDDPGRGVDKTKGHLSPAICDNSAGHLDNIRSEGDSTISTTSASPMIVPIAVLCLRQSNSLHYSTCSLTFKRSRSEQDSHSSSGHQSIQGPSCLYHILTISTYFDLKRRCHQLTQRCVLLINTLRDAGESTDIDANYMAQE